MGKSFFDFLFFIIKMDFITNNTLFFFNNTFFLDLALKLIKITEYYLE